MNLQCKEIGSNEKGGRCREACDGGALGGRGRIVARRRHEEGHEKGGDDDAEGRARTEKPTEFLRRTERKERGESEKDGCGREACDGGALGPGRQLPHLSTEAVDWRSLDQHI